MTNLANLEPPINLHTERPQPDSNQEPYAVRKQRLPVHHVQYQPKYIKLNPADRKLSFANWKKENITTLQIIVFYHVCE